MSMTASATDSRGRTGTATRVISVAPYAPPSIAAFAAARCNSSGSAAQLDGTRGWITLAASASSMSGRNSMSCTVYYKTSSATSWTTAGSYSHSNYNINLNNSALSGSIYFNPLYSYDFRVVVSDYFGSVSMETGLGTKAVVFDILRDGSGVAFGKIAEYSNTLDIGWTLRLASPLPVASGGTGATSLAGVRSAIGLGSGTGALGVAYGGTGTTSLSNLRSSMGLGSSTGVLGVSYGGTGATSLAGLRSSMGLGSSTGTLGISYGGTGATSVASAMQALDLRSGVLQDVTVKKTGLNTFRASWATRSTVPTAVMVCGYGSGTNMLGYWRFSSDSFSTTGCNVYAYRTPQASGSGTISIQYIAI